ncbi:MAG TPA: pyruvate carboxylase [Pirellulales bacterium]|nr:pyruvate carboxylase [Pirellulales bacterium]
MNTFRKLLVANRSEIAIRVFRAAHELGIRTVAIYSHEDRFALHRFKADEAYQVGKVGEPIRAYLDIPGVIAVAKLHEVDAIHPGYGFLAENPALRLACDEAGIKLVGPRAELLEQLGDKTAARAIADMAKVPILAGTKAVRNLAEARRLAAGLGYPIMLKASHGGGGRGMRVVLSEDELAPNLEQAQRESLNAFGSSDVFLEKYIRRARHIEVQLLGDEHGNLVHLYERDCSLQRRNQKVVEIAPAPNLEPDLRRRLCEAALAIGRAVRYENAGTVEFLLDVESGQFYFIEVNPRIQVEHTVTEEVTGIDIVRSQIFVAAGYRLDSPEVGIKNQDSIHTTGFAFQCRVTTEDPENRFVPDYGRIMAYRSASGLGIRLDAGTAFSGAVVTPYYDSLLVKVSARGTRLAEASRRMERCLQEFRVRGVKTNIPFLINLITHPSFLAGKCTTRFIDETPELFQFIVRRDRATKLLQYLGEVLVNGNALVKDRPRSTRREPAPIPPCNLKQTAPDGTRQRLQKLGPEKFAAWVLKQKPLLMTDTTFRDAHQSLLATRMRTFDMLEIAETYARLAPQMFSIEMWGGATFDTAMRFLKESPWQRLADLRTRIPNVLFQMLLRASNAVGYTNYPDNVVAAFVHESAQAGIDLFRIFDPLNWTDNMRVAMDAVQKSGMLCEAAICYTGDILDAGRPKYDLKYYVELAKQLERMGAHILAIKDMAGLCKPFAARELVKTLKQEIGIPIHFHTHDTSGISAASVLKAAEVGLDIADGASAPMSGLTSQPNLNAIVDSLRFTPRETELDPAALRELAHYWQAVREFYTPFESDMKAPDSDLYLHEMPGGQFTNLQEQARALGLMARWPEICQTYAAVNQLLGDIVKVTPTSKAVGDMALFLVTNNLTAEDVLDPGRELAYPESVIDLLAGRMGQNPGGFPVAVKKRVLRDQKPVRGRPGASLPPADFAVAAEKVKKLVDREPSSQEVVSYLLYPRVFQDFASHEKTYSDTSMLPTPAFLYSQQQGEELSVDIEPGKTLIVKLLTISEPHADARRTVFFELNGQPRSVSVGDRTLETTVVRRPKADPADAKQIAAPMPGLVVGVAVKIGDAVRRGQKLLTLEAMKMETTLYAEADGRVADLLVKPGTPVEAGELVARME